MKEKIRKNAKKYNKYFGIAYTSNTNIPFIFDLEDYERIKQFCWLEGQNGYIVTGTNKGTIYLHKLIIPTDHIVDHINRNKKDNRKENLRIVTCQQNCMNKSMQKNNLSGITGVYFDKDRKRWVGQLIFKNKKYTKRFFTKNEAIEYRKKLEKEYFKEYAPKDKNSD